MAATDTSLVLVNLGCGGRIHPEWLNIDFVALVPGVHIADLRKGIPLESNHADVVYHSHVLEHFSKDMAVAFLQECYRVLKPGGILRVVVPDLEQLARNYLQALQAAIASDSPVNRANYDWSVIELLDQMVRQQPGGAMLQYWMQPQLLNEQLLEQRLGHEFVAWRNSYRNTAPVNVAPAVVSSTISWKSRLRSWWHRIKRTKPQAPQPFHMEETGELHKWMYDRYAIKRLLEQVEFESVQSVDAFTSNIPGWTTWQMLDVEEGRTRKPDSLFAEARKPK